MAKSSNKTPHKREKLVSSVFYVNYAPYGNAGHILDFLKKNAHELIYLCLVFHPQEKTRNMLEVYRDGVLTRQIQLMTFRPPKRFVHEFAPLLSIICFTQIMWVAFLVRARLGIKPHFYLSPNAFPVVAGILLRALSLVDRVVYWVWDYYPTPKKGGYKKLLFRFYWALDRWCTRKSDFDWYLNERLLEIRERHGIVFDKTRMYVQPLGISPIRQEDVPDDRSNIVGFVGVLKHNQGLELLLESLPALVKRIPELKIEIIGTGPDENDFRRMVSENRCDHLVSFKGFIEDDEDMREIMKSWDVAAALYVPSEENASAYADPSKVRQYLGVAVPVILTDVPLMAGEIVKAGAGIVVDYKQDQLVSAVARIMGERTKYKQRALQLARRYEYTKVYNEVFGRFRHI